MVWLKVMNFKLIGQRKGKTWVDLLATDKLPFPAFIICYQITSSSCFAIQKQVKEWKDGKIFLGEFKWSRPYRWTKKHVQLTNAWTKLFLQYILIIRPSEIVTCEMQCGSETTKPTTTVRKEVRQQLWLWTFGFKSQFSSFIKQIAHDLPVKCR